MALRQPVAYGHHSIVHRGIDPHCMTRGYDRLVAYMDPQCNSFGGYISLCLCYVHLDKENIFLTILSVGLLHRSYGTPPPPLQFLAWYNPFRPSVSSFDLMH